MTFIYRIQNVYTFEITNIFIIYNLNTIFSYISISVHSTLFNLCFFSYIGVILHPYCVIPMYVCTIMHVCIISTKSGLIKIVHAVLLYLKMVYLKWYISTFTELKSQESQLSMDIWHGQLFFFLSFCFWRLYPVTARRPAGGRYDGFLKD